jgi:hypothetical protein
LQKLLHVDAKVLDIIAEVTGNQVMFKDVMAGRNRCMGGKYRASRNDFQGAGEVIAGTVLARWSEQWLPGMLPWGSFLAVELRK